MRKNYWTPEQDKVLTKLWLDGTPASEIAERFAEHSKASCIHRTVKLGLPRRHPRMNGSHVRPQS